MPSALQSTGSGVVLESILRLLVAAVLGGGIIKNFFDQGERDPE